MSAPPPSSAVSPVGASAPRPHPPALGPVRDAEGAPLIVVNEQAIEADAPLPLNFVNLPEGDGKLAYDDLIDLSTPGAPVPAFTATLAVEPTPAPSIAAAPPQPKARPPATSATASPLPSAPWPAPRPMPKPRLLSTPVPPRFEVTSPNGISATRPAAQTSHSAADSASDSRPARMAERVATTSAPAPHAEPAITLRPAPSAQSSASVPALGGSGALWLSIGLLLVLAAAAAWWLFAGQRGGPAKSAAHVVAPTPATANGPDRTNAVAKELTAIATATATATAAPASAGAETARASESESEANGLPAHAAPSAPAVQVEPTASNALQVDAHGAAAVRANAVPPAQTSQAPASGVKPKPAASGASIGAQTAGPAVVHTAPAAHPPPPKVRARPGPATAKAAAMAKKRPAPRETVRRRGESQLEYFRRRKEQLRRELGPR